MPVRYLQFEVQVHGLAIEDAADVERICTAIRDAVRALNMSARFDVDVFLTESAGKPSIGKLP